MMTQSETSAGLAEVHRAYFLLRTAFESYGGLTVPQRRDALRALRAAIKRDTKDFVEAISADFGSRSRYETLLAEIVLIIGAIDFNLARLTRWAAPSAVSPGWQFWPAHARILKQPRGVAGVIAPGNYPLNLAIMPVISALAAGCRVLVKPSETTPRTSALIQKSIAAALDPEIVSVVCGDASVSAGICELPLDILLFTGSARTGRLVMGAAATQLTPVILELGGKSPVIIDRGADLTIAATSIMAGKLFNAGQTCIAPDYVLVPRDMMDGLVEKLVMAAHTLHRGLRDYTAVAPQAAVARLDALAAGHDLVPVFDAPVSPPHYAPALVLSPSLDSAIMQEEIFGPLLPVLPYDELDQALAIIRERPSPLVLYWFGTNRITRDYALSKTASGSVAVNETILQFGVHALPFGGIGGSGMGRYRGKAGFDAFTHERPVFEQARFSSTALLRPPYGLLARLIIKFLAW